MSKRKGPLVIESLAIEVDSNGNPDPPWDSDELSDRELIHAVQKAAVTVANWKRLSQIRDQRRNKLVSATQALVETIDEKCRDREGTPDWSSEELVQLFFGAGLWVLYTKVFPDRQEAFEKKMK